MLVEDNRIYSKSWNEELTKNFSLREFHCHCKLDTCTITMVNDQLLTALQLIRNHFKSTIKILSGYRCVQHNIDVGGSKQSQHLIGLAADIIVFDVPPKEVQEYLIMQQDNLEITIGRYDTFTHIDVREEPIIFDRRKQNG